MITSFDLKTCPPPPPRGAVVSVGVFDGVHLGHQAILRENIELASELGARPAVVTFRRHPKRVLLGHEPRTLTSLEHRLELFRRAGVQQTLVLTFDEELRRLEADDFVRSILIERLGARAYVLGFDSKFGRDKRGTPEFLAKRGHDVRVVEQVQVGGRAVSSTAMREAVELGDLDGARRMLGRRVGVMGTVVRGDALGREIGFPTANLNLHHELHPPPGVYAGWATLVGDVARAGAQLAPQAPHLHPAVANIGVRPTIDQNRPSRPRLEVHLLDFAGDLYGQNLEFSFAERLRGEVRFPSVDALKTQIARDVARARELLPRLDP